MSTAPQPSPPDPHQHPDPEQDTEPRDGTLQDGSITIPIPRAQVVDLPTARARRRPTNPPDTEPVTGPPDTPTDSPPATPPDRTADSPPATSADAMTAVPATPPATGADTIPATPSGTPTGTPAVPVVRSGDTVPVPVDPEVSAWLASASATPAAPGPATNPDMVSAPVVSGRVVATGPDARPALATRAVAAARTGAVVVRGVVTHRWTTTTVKAISRNVLYVPAGVACLAKRAWDARSTARFERMMHAAEASGNAELMAEWQRRAELFKAARHDRLMRWIHAPVAIARGLAVGFITSVLGLLVLGGLLASARHDAGTILAPLQTAVTALNAVVLAAQTAWTPLVTVAPWAVLVLVWNEGRRRGPVPTWLATASAADLDVAIDEHTIARALLALRIPQIRDALKVAPLQFITTARKDGRGTHAVVRLPAGVTAEKIAGRRADLATGLYRLATEVWPTTGSEAGVLDLWVADKGSLAEGAGPYPLLGSGTVDVFKGVPFGKTLRGDPVTAPVMERNAIVGGLPGQGKSSATRCIMIGAALDPTCELRIWVPDANFDFEAFRPRCSRYVMGAEDEKIEEIVADLRALKAEVQTRGELLVKYQIAAVTRSIARRGVGLHPLVCLLEEAHVVFQHPTYGSEARQLVTDIVRLGRKRGIHLIISTQAPTKDSIPRDVTRNCSNGIAFAVGDHVANDALLGAGAYKAGHRATELIPGTDRGTALVKGFTGERSQIVQIHYLGVDKGNDQITPLINRSLTALRDQALPVPGRGRGAPVPVRRDLLEDLAQVLGNDPVPAADIPALLSRAWPKWAPYRDLTGKRLRAILLREYGIKVPSTGNRWPLDPVTVRDVLAHRDQDTDRPDQDQ